MNEHFEKYEAMAQAIGIDKLVNMVPFTQGEVRTALANGDTHLNSLPLRKWDAMHMWVRMSAAPHYRTWPLSYTVCVLKHVAEHHYI